MDINALFEVQVCAVLHANLGLGHQELILGLERRRQSAPPLRT